MIKRTTVCLQGQTRTNRGFGLLLRKLHIYPLVGGVSEDATVGIHANMIAHVKGNQAGVNFNLIHTHIYGRQAGLNLNLIATEIHGKQLGANLSFMIGADACERSAYAGVLCKYDEIIKSFGLFSVIEAARNIEKSAGIAVVRFAENVKKSFVLSPACIINRMENAVSVSALAILLDSKSSKGAIFAPIIIIRDSMHWYGKIRLLFTTVGFGKTN